MVIDEKLEDPLLESKAREIFKNIKCSVCQGQAIDESDNGLAYDLRKLIREELKNGHSKDEIEAYLVKSFGEDIILTPQFNLSTSILWVSPFIILFLGIFLVKKYL